MGNDTSLIEKYNVPGPRYTSYPTVPYWEVEKFTAKDWIKEVANRFMLTNGTEGISLYIHLPYCESLCTYCGCNTRITVNHDVELPYINAVLQEWEIYKRIFGRPPHIKAIHLGGGTPTFFKPENLFILIDGIISGSIVNDEVEFSFEGHPVNTTFEHLKVLRGLGFRRVSFGVQDFDQNVQKAINRIQTENDITNVTTWARALGYDSINFDLVYGLPFQHEGTVKNTIQKVIDLKPDRIAYYSYAHVPWLKPGQRAYSEEDLPSGEVKRALYEMGRNMLEQNGYIEIGMDHFALATDALTKAKSSKTLHRNFMGYTEAKTSLLIGLGVSSISDAGTAFAQNFKTVEKYIEEVQNGNLPVFKGHLLDEEDLILRKHILQLICKYETNWECKEDQCHAITEALVDLEEMERDGLISVGNNKISIHEKGYPFVRNVCMAFDRRLCRNSKEQKLFSKII